MSNRIVSLNTKPDELAKAFRGFEGAHADHLILVVTPEGSVEAIEKVAEGLRLHRA